jgi:hypothetical protein
MRLNQEGSNFECCQLIFYGSSNRKLKKFINQLTYALRCKKMLQTGETSRLNEIYANEIQVGNLK